jgi:serpin B
MNRTAITRAARLLVSCMLGACGATNTGNPNQPLKGDAPQGVTFFQSKLEREDTSKLDTADRAQNGQDSRDFALALYAQAASDATDNVFLSPYSVSVALAMTYAGAAGKTKTEMADALHFSLPDPLLHHAWNATERELEGREHELSGSELSGEPGAPMSTGDGMQLEITNGVFVQKGFTPRAPFLDTLAVNYGAGIYAADFAKDPERARVAINDWTAKRTHDRVVDLLPRNSVDDAVLVLLNAIYFKASWLTPFDPAKTKPGTFHALSGDVMVDMMHGGAADYAEGDGYQAVSLPYISPDVELFIVLPAAGRFDEIEAGFDRTFFDRVHGALSSGYTVDFALPRFKLPGKTFSLAQALQALGMKLAFQAGSADLSGIAGKPGDLFIGDVFHQAFLAIDETGTEAAAATAVVVRTVSAPPPPIPVTFTVDRPCLFAIYDRPTGQILFVGRLVNPPASKS